MAVERPSRTGAVATRRLAALGGGALLLAGACAGAVATVGSDAEPASSEVRAAAEVDVVRAVAPAPPVTATTLLPPPAALPGADGRPLPVEVGDLREGLHGPRTVRLQRALAGLGFAPGDADGSFDRETTMAVWAFQALAGLPKDGVVTEVLERQIATAPPVAMLRPDLGPTHTEVDITRQVLLVWGDGRLELVTHVSTGAEVPYCENGACGDAITPEGTFRYEYRIPGERHAQLGVLHDPVYFDFDGHAVHGDPEVPDRPASHGCVRIPMHLSAHFPTLVADGEVIGLFRS
jgi:peptidoglycan hydrolase-like protein with peptidoglycan-binding domain